jgi:hypothetical protein
MKEDEACFQELRQWDVWKFSFPALSTSCPLSHHLKGVNPVFWVHPPLIFFVNYSGNFWRKWSFLCIVIILVVLSNDIIVESSAFLFVLWGIAAVNFIFIEMFVFFSERKRVLYLNFFLWFGPIAHLNLHLYLLTLISHRIRYGCSSLKLLLPFSKIYDFRFLVERTHGGIR